MSLNIILKNLEKETKKPDFKKHVIQDYGSEGETARVWYSLYSEKDFEEGHFPEPEGEKWEEALDQYILDAWDEFESRFFDIAEMEDEKLVIYREITVDSIPKFLYFLQKGKTIPGLKGMGIYWSWDRDLAEAHWSEAKHAVLIKGLVDISNINYQRTALKNLNPALGVEEAEIEVKKGAPIIIKEVFSDKHGKEIWKGQMKVTASLPYGKATKVNWDDFRHGNIFNKTFKAKVLAKYQISRR